MAQRNIWRSREFVVIPRALLTQKISPSALRVWLALASFCFQEDSCFPSNRALLERMPDGMSERSIQRGKRELELFGLLRRERRFLNGRETSSLYHLISPESPDNFVTLPDSKTTPDHDSTVTPLKSTTIKKTKDGDIFIEGVGWIVENS